MFRLTREKKAEIEVAVQAYLDIKIPAALAARKSAPPQPGLEEKAVQDAYGRLTADLKRIYGLNEESGDTSARTAYSKKLREIEKMITIGTVRGKSGATRESSLDFLREKYDRGSGGRGGRDSFE